MGGTIIVTGASRGIGAATALLAADHGYAVCVNYAQHGERAQAVVATIRAAGGSAIAVQADVADEEAVRAMVERATAELGPLTALVNNAGLTGPLGPVATMEAATVRRVLDVNVVGTLLCAREAIRRMARDAGGMGGAIVNVSSRAAQYGSPGEFIPYAASKAAIETVTIGLAREVAAQGIRVNCVSCGFMDTELHAAAGDGGRLQRHAAQVPMQRAGRPDEAARAILWLLSDAASYSTGAIVAVSGGR
ncbi:MAG TPA: SDR family oxidoreductase [Chloroflexota bacterium]|jgi:NAD(P)-dependent dehydrogenase (short-subunit alcohol dehydrogenase family)|nr:SDR family oxidoreductase [Chloroflexota bacterium]